MEKKQFKNDEYLLFVFINMLCLSQFICKYKE